MKDPRDNTLQRNEDGSWSPAEPYRCLGLFPYLIALWRGEARCVFCGWRWGVWYGFFGTDAKQYPKNEHGR